MSDSAKSPEDRRAGKLAAAERIAARRKRMPADFDEDRNCLNILMRGTAYENID